MLFSFSSAPMGPEISIFFRLKKPHYIRNIEIDSANLENIPSQLIANTNLPSTKDRYILIAKRIRLRLQQQLSISECFLLQEHQTLLGYQPEDIKQLLKFLYRMLFIKGTFHTLAIFSVFPPG